MKKGLTDEWVEMIWSHAVMPYLEEHFFGQPDRVDAFALQALRQRLPSAGQTGTATGTESSEADRPD